MKFNLFFKLRIGALIPRSVSLFVSLSVLTKLKKKNIAKVYIILQNLTNDINECYQCTSYICQGTQPYVRGAPDSEMND